MQRHFRVSKTNITDKHRGTANSTRANQQERTEISERDHGEQFHQAAMYTQAGHKALAENFFLTSWLKGHM